MSVARARAATAFLLLVSAGCRSAGEGGAATSPRPTGSPPQALPAAFAGRKNPLPDDGATRARGRELFLRNCAPCHGPDGDGKGPASTGLSPAPANFRDPTRVPSRGDDYLFWRLSTGIPESAMPAFGATLSEEERWAILRFVRHLSDGNRDP